MTTTFPRLQFTLLLVLVFATSDILHAREPAKTLHAKLVSARTYMGYTRENKSEFWIEKNKLYRGRRNSIYISRQDLKKQWVIDTVKMTYNEYPIEKEKREKQKEDIHTFGQDYEPRFDWTQTQLPRKTINGFECDGIGLEGIDDFANTKITLWICAKSAIENPGVINDLVLNGLNTTDEREKVLLVLKSFNNPLLIKLEERIENPIAPEINLSLSVTAAENAIPPSGIFELPKNLKKTEMK